jgi:hypothetical protein
MEATKFKHYHRSVTYYLPQLHETHRKIILQKLHLALDLAQEAFLEVPTLEEAYRHYGKAVYRVALIKETNHLIMTAWGGYNCLEPWTDETWKIFEHATKSEALWKEMIDTITHHQSLSPK